MWLRMQPEQKRLENTSQNRMLGSWTVCPWQEACGESGQKEKGFSGQGAPEARRAGALGHCVGSAAVQARDL